MYWTLELASKLEDAPWPATKDENLEELEDDDELIYDGILDLWPDYPTNDEDFFFNEDEY